MSIHTPEHQHVLFHDDDDDHDDEVAHLEVAVLAVFGHIAQVVVVIQKRLPGHRGLLKDVGDLFRAALLLHGAERKRKRAAAPEAPSAKVCLCARALKAEAETRHHRDVQPTHTRARTHTELSSKLYTLSKSYRNFFPRSSKK